MSKAKQKSGKGNRGSDRWPNFAWGVLAFLIVFHIANNYVVLRMDTQYFNGDTRVIYQWAVEFLEGLPEENLAGKITSFYIDTPYNWPPLFQAASALFLALFGYSQDVAVMANALFIPLMFVSMYLLGKELFNRETGLVAAILFSFFPGMLSMSRLYRPDVALAAFLIPSILILIKSKDMTSTRWSILFGIVLGLMALTKSSFSLILVGPFIVLVVIPLLTRIGGKEFRNIRRILTNIALAGLIGTLIAVPWYAAESKTYLAKERAVEGPWETPAGEDVPNVPHFGSPFLKFFFTNLIRHHPGTIFGPLMLKPIAWVFLAASLWFFFKGNQHRALLLSWMMPLYLFLVPVEAVIDWIHLLRHFNQVLPAVAMILALFFTRIIRATSKVLPASLKKDRYTCMRMLVVLLILIEIPLFLAITYRGQGTVETPWGSEKAWMERIIELQHFGILSPYNVGFDVEQVADVLEDEWAGMKSPPQLFVLNPQGIVSSEGILSEMQIRKRAGRVDFLEDNCYGVWYRGPGEESALTCEEIFYSSDYAIIESIKGSEAVFDNPEWAYSQEIEPLMRHIQSSLGNHTLMMVLEPSTAHISDSVTWHPCFDWLNGSVWILKKDVNK